MVVRVAKKCRSSLTRNRRRYLSTVPKKLVRFMELDDNQNYDLQWTLMSDGSLSVRFVPKCS
jgi:hypothetical protein